jgi:hypothetical protein
MERARSGEAGAERAPKDGQVGRAETGSTASGVKVDSFPTAITMVGVRDALGGRILVAPRLRILPELFGICRCKWFIFFRIRGA